MARGRKDYEKAVVSVESEGFANPHGRILMYDDFEDTPLKWQTGGMGTHFETRQPTAAYNGSYGLQLDTTQAAASYSLIPIDVTERLLLEFFWQPELIARLTYFEVSIRFFDGNRRHYTAINYDRIAGTWDYWNTVGGWTLIPGAAQSFYDAAWNELTLSADFTTDEYIIFKSNNLEINMGGIACQNIFSGLGAHAEIWISAFADCLYQLIVNVDDVVIRELEV